MPVSNHFAGRRGASVAALSWRASVAALSWRASVVALSWQASLCLLACSILAPLAAAAPAAPEPRGSDRPLPAVFLSAQATPDSVRGWISAAGDSSDWPEDDRVGVFDRTEVVVEPTGLGHVRRHTLTKVLTETGARDLGTLRLDYDPASNMIRLETVRVHQSGGRTLVLDPAGTVDLAAPADMIYWGARMKLFSLPRLQVGDAIEVETYKKGYQIAYLDAESEQAGTAVETGPAAASDTAEEAGPADAAQDDERYTPPMRGHFYDVVTFQEGYPLVEKTYRLKTPRDKPVQFAVYNGSLISSLRFADSLLVYEWRAEDVPALELESRTPDLTDLAVKVVLATVENWPAKSRWFFEVNEPVFAADAAIQSKVRDLTEGLRSDDEKMAVLLHWVAQEIRYSGLSMGKGEGYTLHPGVMTFQDRCGVCKDIAGMLVTMLRAAGYAANPVMTMAGSRVEAVPADQFNHCVVAVERPDGSYTMLDPTWAPFDRSVWSRSEGEQHYVIGSSTGEGLNQIRSFTPEESRMTIQGQARLDAAGTLTGTLTFRGTGASDSRLRGILADTPAGEGQLAVADLLGSLGPGVEITALEFTNPRDFSQDAVIEASYRVPRYALLSDSVLTFRPPLLAAASKNARLCRLLSFSGSKERKQEALLWSTQEMVVRDRLTLPAGFRFDAAGDTVRVEREAGSVRGSCRASGGDAVVELTAVTAKRTVPAEEWSGGLEAADSLRAFGDRTRLARRSR